MIVTANKVMSSNKKNVYTALYILKSGQENTEETAALTSSERQTCPLLSTQSTVQQQQGNNATQQRMMQNFRSLFAPSVTIINLISIK